MGKQKAAKKSVGGGCMVLFGLPFLIGGIVMCWLFFSTCIKWWQAQQWEEVPCSIQSTDLKVSHGRKSTTYQAEATYRYRYGGRDYKGDTVSFSSGGDNIGSFQEKAYRELSSYVERRSSSVEMDEHKEGRSFRCYVNPANPSESVLYRTLRWEMQAFWSVFCLTFPAIGAAVVLGGFVEMRRAGKESVLRKHHPDEPWMWKWNWAQRSIPEDARAWKGALHAYTIWSGIIVLLLISSAALSGAFQRDGLSWLLLIFVAIWCIPAWLSLKRLRHRAAVGEVRFEPLQFPASPGGLLNGDMLLGKWPFPREYAEITLFCEESISSKTGSKSSTKTVKIWSQTVQAGPEKFMRDVSGYRLPVEFALPFDAAVSGVSDDPAIEHHWKLHLKVPGTVIDARFEVPVFHSRTSRIA